MYVESILKLRETYFFLLDEWKYRENRRKFFERFAEENSFDSLNPDHWYSQLSALQSVGVLILFYYNSFILK